MTFQKGNKYGIKKGEKLWKLRDPNNPNLVRTQFKKGYSNPTKGRRAYSFICKNCNKEVPTYYKGRKYCNQKCFGEFHRGENHPLFGKHPSTETILKRSKTVKERGNLRGSKNPSWKGGVTPYIQKLRTSPIYDRWRRLVFERDNYTCQKENCPYCNNKQGGIINAHHIVPVAECMALDYKKLILDIDNGTTLCESYHQSIRWKDGK